MATQGTGCVDLKASEGKAGVGRRPVHERQVDTATYSDPGRRLARQRMVALGHGSNRTRHLVRPSHSGREYDLAGLIES